jgi:hypothetical protein
LVFGSAPNAHYIVRACHEVVHGVRDHVKVATVDLSSTSPLQRQVVYAANGLNPNVTHTLQVKVLGTANRPRVDAFVVLR